MVDLIQQQLLTKILTLSQSLLETVLSQTMIFFLTFFNNQLVFKSLTFWVASKTGYTRLRILLRLILLMSVVTWELKCNNSNPMLQLLKSYGCKRLTLLLRELDHTLKLLPKTWNGLLVKSGKVLNGATTLIHAEQLLKNTEWWPLKLLWLLLLNNNSKSLSCEQIQSNLLFHIIF